jgi:hypothetical protein
MLRQWLVDEFRPWLFDQLSRIGVVGGLGSAVAAFYAMVAVHEFGHLFAGLCVGFRCRSVRVGPLLIHFPLRLSFYRGPGAIVNGVAEMIPIETDKLAWRGVTMVLGGPAANFLSALTVYLLPLPISIFSGCFIAVSIVNGLSDLLPFESRLGISDGKRIWMLLRQRASGERWLSLLRLASELNDGVLPESLPADFLAKAIAVRDDSVDTVTAHAVAYSTAFHQHDNVNAGQMLETALAYSGHAMPLLREALMSDAAVFQARRRQRTDLAGLWLAEIPASTPNQWFRTRAEAAILESIGDLDGAVRKLADVEAAISYIPNIAQRNTMLKLLQRWRSELSRV